MDDDIKLLRFDELWTALDGLYAYDCGSLDSGIRDEALRFRVQQQMRLMSAEIRRVFIAQQIRENYLSDEAIANGYGLEDAAKFWRWLDEEMECAI